MAKKEPEAPKKKGKGEVIPPEPEPTKMEMILNEWSKEVDAARANMHFNGGCLPVRLAKEAQKNKLTCETKMNEKMDLFDLYQDGTPEMMHLTQVRYMTCPEGC